MTAKYERLKARIATMEEVDKDHIPLETEDRKLIAMALRSIKAVADEHHNSGPFICGTIGEVDDQGLYPGFMVCPQYGLSGFAVYKKERDYSEPGY